MAQSEAALRREQAIEQLIQRQAQRALQRSKTTIVDGEIVRTPPPQPTPSPFAGTGNKVGEGDDPAATPGPGMPHLARGRQIKASIDQAGLDTIAKIKGADPQSPFVADVDPILSETAKLITDAPDEFRAPTYEKRQMARLKTLSDCRGDLRQDTERTQQMIADLKLPDEAPERVRIKNICDQAASDMRANPDGREGAKDRAMAALDQLAALAKARTNLDKELAEAVRRISEVAPGSVFLQDVEALRNQIATLIAQGNMELASPEGQVTRVKRIGAIPLCAATYGEIRIRSQKLCDGVLMIRPEAPPEVGEAQILCDRAIAALRATPEKSDAIKISILQDFATLEIAAKRNAVTYWEDLIEDKYKSAKNLPDNAQQALGVLDSIKPKTNLTFEEIQTRLSSFVRPVLGTAARTSTGPRLGRSGLPTMTRAQATTNGVRVGRAAPKAVKEIAKSGDRTPASALLFSGGISNSRSGYSRDIYHWHVFGNALNNMIYHADGRLLGFVDGHIQKDSKEADQAGNVENRSLDSEWINIGVFNDQMFEITDL